MIKACFIDIDNTILDFDAYVKNTLKEGFRVFGIAEYEPWMYDTFETENNKLWLAIERGGLTLTELKKIRFNNVFAALGVTGDGPEFETYFREKLNESAIPVDGAAELIKYLSGKYILCAASNGPQGQQENRLAIAGLKPYFSRIFTSEGLGVSKPAPLFGDKCVSALADSGISVSPEEIIMIGDSVTSDMALGKNCGYKTLFYNRSGTDASSHGYDYVVSSLREILEIL